MFSCSLNVRSVPRGEVRLAIDYVGENTRMMAT